VAAHTRFRNAARVTRDRRWERLLPAEPIRFEEEFRWGVASSAFQAEGGDVPNDWVALAREGRFPPNPGNGFWERAEEDFRLVASLGIRHYRLSVEWSRVEPERGRFDENALDRYRAICDAAREAGVEPWVNLFHFTHPSWFARRGGFLEPANHDDFLRYAERVGRALHGHARQFHSQNESMVYVLGAYLVGELPPFVTDRERAYQITRSVLALHARTHGILKEIDARHRVTTIEVYLNFRAEDPDDEENQSSVQELDRWYHGCLLDGLATGRIELPGCESEEIPGLQGALDAYGLNYYSTTLLGKSGIGSYSDLDDPPIDTMGRAVHPRGLEEGLLRVSRALPGVPILVTENGCPTTDEDFRIRYLAAHLAALDRARRAGADVGGYFHWTAVDNYEWNHGFSDARFGLIGFDPESLERRPKRSAQWLADLIARGSLDPASIP
jgi:beta-glucosidase